MRGATKHVAYSIWYKPETGMLEVQRVGLHGFLKTKRIQPTDLVQYKSKINPLLTYRSKSMRYYKLGTDYCGNWTNKPLFDQLISGTKV